MSLFGKKKKQQKSKSDEGGVQEAFRQLTTDEDEERIDLSMRTILGGDILGGRWFRKQFWFIVMVVVMCIIYVSNRYYCQQEMIEGTRLADTLKDRHIKVLTIESALKEQTRRSNVEQHLQDTTLKPSTDRIYTLPVDVADSVAAEDDAAATSQEKN